jgi:hypothetical protein
LKFLTFGSDQNVESLDLTHEDVDLMFVFYLFSMQIFSFSVDCGDVLFVGRNFAMAF